MTNEEYIKQLLPKLKQVIPHQWRVQSFSKNKAMATVMAYIDARDAMDLLDAHCDYGWARRHYEVDNKVYCALGIYMPDGTLHERSDCGVESNQDAQKGQASDAFKRAAVNWGVGRFLYDLEVQYVTTNESKKANNFPYCVDDQGKRIYDITKYVNNKSTKPASNCQQNPEEKKSDNAGTTPTPALQWLNAGTDKWKEALKFLKNGGTMDQIKKKYKLSKENEQKLKEESLKQAA